MAHLNISIIDDSFDDCLAITRRLAKDADNHYETELLHDFESGLAAILDQTADLYFVDLDLDGANGLELLRRAQAAQNRKPIVVVTGNENPAIDMQALDLGATDFLNKNEISERLLTRTIRHAITRKAWELKWQHAANHDALTELAQKHHFQTELSRAISRHQRSGDAMALVLIDLDRFKPVNDEHGHSAGDALLKRVAESLTRSVRNGDLVGRLGGDEFAILLECIHDEDLASIEKVVQDRVADPMRWRGKELSVGWSLGTAVFPTDGDSVDALMEIADTRMYANKQRSASRLVTQR